MNEATPKKKIITKIEKKITSASGETNPIVEEKWVDIPDVGVQFLEDLPPELSWQSLVYARFNNKCGNCGSTERLVVRLIVPEEHGGQKIESNGVVLCRTCDLASKLSPKPGAASFQRPYNFYVNDQMLAVVERHSAAFRGKAGFLRHLMDTFSIEPHLYDDLAKYQSSGDHDIKINFHMDSLQFEKFKAAATSHGLTMTDALRGLLLMFDQTRSSNV